MEYIEWFSWYTLIIVALIVVLVVALLGWCAWRFNERSEPGALARHPQHAGRGIMDGDPGLVLVAIAIPSFKLLYGEYDPTSSTRITTRRRPSGSRSSSPASSGPGT